MTAPEDKRPFNVLNIDHLVFRVTDLERSIAFYEEVLGCKVVKRRDDLGLIHLRAGRSMLDLVSVGGRLGQRGGDAPGAGARNVDHLCLRIEPFDEPALIRHLASHNVEPTGPVSNNFGAEGNGPSLYVHDPDGNLVELKGPPGEPVPGMP
jgi:catechol 2,3-dioxygenase-like lactoylglutathione lyase family enzyme